MPETRHELLQHLAAFLLGRTRELVPGHVGITIVLHDHGVDEWTAATTLRDDDRRRLLEAFAQHEKPRSTRVPYDDGLHEKPRRISPPRPPHIKCLMCGLTSYHRTDIKQKFCGNCDTWHDQDAQPPTFEIGPTPPAVSQPPADE